MSRPHRLDPAAYVGIRQYFLTICTYQRRRHFDRADWIALVREQFLRIAIAEQFAIPAYCFMPDHLHALVEAQLETADLQRFVRLAKQHSGYLFLRVAGRRLWQDSYSERVIRSHDRLAGVIRYIIDNAVREGLVQTPFDYPHWGSQIYSREQILEFVAREGGTFRMNP